jgi:hypothetical protein
MKSKFLCNENNILHSELITMAGPCTVYTTNIIPIIYPCVLSLYMCCCILLTASRPWVLSGVTGPFQWRGTMVLCSRRFRVTVFHMHLLIDMWLRMLNWHRLKLFIMLHKNLHSDLLELALEVSVTHSVHHHCSWTCSKLWWWALLQIQPVYFFRLRAPIDPHPISSTALLLCWQPGLMSA